MFDISALELLAVVVAALAAVGPEKLCKLRQSLASTFKLVTQNSGNSSDKPMPIASHLRELRRRVLVSASAMLAASLIAVPASPRIFEWLARPMNDALHRGEGFIALGAFETWVCYFNIALVSGVVLSLPVWMGQIFLFARPALSKTARRRILILSLFAGACFTAGVIFCRSFILPWAFVWTTGLANSSGIQLLPQMAPYISLSLSIMLAFGLAFETPIFTAIAIRLGIVSVKTASKARPYVIIAAFIVGAVLTPPDVLSQVALALPLIVLYEVGLLIGKIGLAKSGRPVVQYDLD